MRRRLLNLLTAMSLVLCVAVVALWLGSYWRVPRAAHYSRDYDGAPLKTQEAYIVRGRLFARIASWGRGGQRMSDLDLSYSPIRKDAYETTAVQSDWMGIGYTSHVNPAIQAAFEYRVASAPCWLLVAASATPALAAAGRWRRKAHRAGAGLCTPCGYDLTGNVSGVCPECGSEWLTTEAATVRPATSARTAR